MKNNFLKISDLFLLIYTTCLLIISCYPKPKEDPLTVAKELLKIKNGRIDAVFFVPRDPIKALILALIQSEQKSILIAQFRLNDKDIIDALVAAHSRGVRIQIITDQTALLDKYNKIQKLLLANIPIHVYAHSFSIMHHKFFIFGQSLYNQPLVLFGSANMTRFGYHNNRESIKISNDYPTIKAYAEEFLKLMRETAPLKNFRKKTTNLPTLSRHPTIELYEKLIF